MRETSLLSLLKREEKAVDDIEFYKDSIEYWNSNRECPTWDEMVVMRKRELLIAEMNLTAVRSEIQSYFKTVLNL